MITEQVPLVGRHAELGQLDRLLDLLDGPAGVNGEAGARPAVLDVSGEAGIGKSRLIHERASPRGPLWRR